MAKMHKHLIIQAFVKKPPKKEDERTIEAWLTKIVHDMGMEVLRPATAEYCAQVGNEGMTADILITTSHMVLHTWDTITEDYHSEDDGVDPEIKEKYGLMPFIEFDIYTCSDLDIQMAIDAVQIFEPVHLTYFYMNRKGGLKPITSEPVTIVYDR